MNALSRDLHDIFARREHLEIATPSGSNLKKPRVDARHLKVKQHVLVSIT